MPKLGDKVRVVLEGKIIDTDSGHGECYEVKFEQRDYRHSRTLWLDPDEFEPVEASERAKGSGTSVKVEKPSTDAPNAGKHDFVPDMFPGYSNDVPLGCKICGKGESSHQ